MQALQSSSSYSIQYRQAKIEDHFQEVQSEIESAFNRIEESIDSIYFYFLINHPKLSPEFPYVDFLLNYTSQFFEIAKPWVHEIFQNQIKIKEQQIIQADNQQQNILYKKTNNEGEEIHQQKNPLKETVENQNMNMKQPESIFNKMNSENQIQQQNKVLQVENVQKQLEQQQLRNDKQIELKLIDDSNKQILHSFAIVFDQTGSIMISSDDKQIKIWNFEQGKLKLTNTYQGHTNNVLCLTYSQYRNNFFSGSRDKTIICWQQINQNEWKCSQQYQQHSQEVNCLMLNKQEDQLISGGLDNSIKVWQVDFIKNELNFLYSLDQHTNSINSFSFNQSETILASCGYTHFIIWEKGQKGEWVFQYIIDQTKQLYLLTYLYHLFILQ